jgi:hypothetical protein
MHTQRIQERVFASKSLLVAATVLSAVIAPPQTRSQDRPIQHELVRSELLKMGKRGEAIDRSRESVVEILEAENGCSEWFKQVDADVTAIFASVHYEYDEKGRSFIYSMSDERGDQQLKHPWAASTKQNGGRGSVIRLNANGPFFGRSSLVIWLDTAGNFVRPGSPLRLVVGSYSGNTAEAQIAILLHELGHIVGRLPDDNDSWDGRSSQNTLEILSHCKPEIRAAARRKLTQR